MVRHSVYFWLVDDLDESQRGVFEGGLRALFGIDAVARGEYAVAASTPERPVTQNSFDYSLFLEFDSVAKHDEYQAHPEHGVFVEQFSPWFQEVRVFDSEIQS